MFISHYYNLQSVPKWACAIFIVRNLSQALISDWNRHRHNPKYYPEDMNTTENHLRYVRPEAFGNYKNCHIIVRLTLSHRTVFLPSLEWPRNGSRI